MAEENDEPRSDGRPCLFRFITAITRVLGLITVAVLWFFAVQAVTEKNKGSYTSWYLVGISPFITFWEVVWLFDKVTCCARDDSCCCKLWSLILWVDGWKKTILYCLLAIPCFTKGIVALWAVLYGILLILLGLLYLLKSIKYCQCVEKRRHYKAPEDPRSSLVNSEVPPGSSQQPVREPNPDWPPPGYAEAPDGSLYAVKAKVVSGGGEQRGYGATDESARDWPPAGYSTGPDGQLQPSEQVAGRRENPFNRSTEGVHQNPQLTQSTDSFNPFDDR